MGLLLTILALWILWKLFKFSLQLMFWLIIIALIAGFVKVLIIPALFVIASLLGWNILRG